MDAEGGPLPCDQGSRSSQENCRLICAEPRLLVLNARSELTMSIARCSWGDLQRRGARCSAFD